MNRQMLASMSNQGGCGGAASMMGLDPSARVFQMDPTSAAAGGAGGAAQGQGSSLNMSTEPASFFAPPSGVGTGLPGSNGGTSQTQQYRSLW